MLQRHIRRPGPLVTGKDNVRGFKVACELHQLFFAVRGHDFQILAVFDQLEATVFAWVHGFGLADALHLPVDIDADSLAWLDRELGHGLTGLALEQLELALIASLNDDFDELVLHGDVLDGFARVVWLLTAFWLHTKSDGFSERFHALAACFHIFRIYPCLRF